jgi:hypothetical protein
LFWGTESQSEGRNHKYDKQPQTIASPWNMMDMAEAAPMPGKLETGFIKCLLFFFLDWFCFLQPLLAFCLSFASSLHKCLRMKYHRPKFQGLQLEVHGLLLPSE